MKDALRIDIYGTIIYIELFMHDLNLYVDMFRQERKVFFTEEMEWSNFSTQSFPFPHNDPS
jgi:hypothetical protein